jgi:predicted transcriptional regulator
MAGPSQYKLSDADVAAIRDMRAKGAKIESLARRFKVDRSTISRIANHRRRRASGK